MSAATTQLQDKTLEDEKEEALSLLSKIANGTNDKSITQTTKTKYISAIDNLTIYIQKFSFYSKQSRKEKYEDGKKFGQTLLELGIVELFCKSIVISKTDLPAIKSVASWLDLMLEVTNYSPVVCDKVMHYDGVLDYFKTFLEGTLEPLNNQTLSVSECFEQFI